LCTLVEQLFHALDSWVIKITEKKNLDGVYDFLLADNLGALVVELLLVDYWLFVHFDIDERYDSFGQFVLWSFNDNDEFLVLIWTNLD